MNFIAPIVEGHGEIAAVPRLLHRIWQTQDSVSRLRCNPPIRVKSGSFLNDDDYFQKYVALAAAKAAQERGAVLILLDCDDACPAVLGPSLLSKAEAIRHDVKMIVALAYREFETWFIAAASSLRGARGLPATVTCPTDFEGIRDAKGWLGRQMNVAYDPITHQVEFVELFDLQGARASRSFNRLFEKILSVRAAP